MRLFIGVTGALIALTCATRGFSADEPSTAFRGAKILTAAGAVYDPGTLIIKDGKIAAVGPQHETPIPDGAAVHDVKGKVIIPGLVDSHSHLGVYSRPTVPSNRDGNERSGPVQAVVRALDSLNPFDPGIRMANAGGVTTANIMPGSGNVIGGQTIYVKLRGYTPEQMRIESEKVLGGLKMANGENPKRYGTKGKAPGTRMKVAALQRTEFIKAREYSKKWADYRKKVAAGEEDLSTPDVDLTLQPLSEVLDGRRTVHFHTHRADDILTVLRLKQEFGFELVIQHGTEGYKVIDEIARHNVPVSMTVVDSPGGKAEVVDLIEQCGADLTKAGVKVHVNTDDPITESRFFLRTTATTVRGGLSEDIALQSITLFPAEALHLDHRVGSLEEGKDADFVVLSGPPFSIYSRVLQTYIDGRKVFELDDETQRLHQLGGFGVAQRSRIPVATELIKPLPEVKAPAAPNGSQDATKLATAFVVLAGRLHTVSGKSINDAAVLVRDGQIAFAGPRAEFKFAGNVPVVSAAVVTPGLIDAHSVVPLAGEYNIPADQDADERTDPNQADVRVLDGFNPAEPLMQYLLEQGVTIVHACPGRANVIGGLTGVFRTHGRTAHGMTVRFPQAMMFNLGGAPKTTYKEKRPETRMGTAALIRTALADASNYLTKLKNKDEDDPAPDRDLKHEALALALNNKIPAIFCAHRADDILTAIRLSREFKLNTTLALATEGFLVVDELAAAEIPVIVHPTMQRVGGIETYNTFLGNAAALSDKGLTIAIGSGVESYVPKTRVIRYEAAMAMVYGLGFDRALRAITLDAARILGIDEQYGSIEPGKIADLVLYDGDPFEHVTHVTHVVANGRLVYDRTKKEPIPLAQRLFYSSPAMRCCAGF